MRTRNFFIDRMSELPALRVRVHLSALRRAGRGDLGVGGGHRLPENGAASAAGPEPRAADMSISHARLTQAAGIAAVVAGLIYIGVQINHPPLDVSTIATTEVSVRSTAKLVMGALALGGITGMYLRQVRQAGALGLIGYLLLVAFYLVLMPIEFTAAYVLPSLADTDPHFVNDVLAVAEGGTAKGDIGLLQIAFYLAGGLYVAGGVVFGIALLRARVLARSPAALLIVGTAATLALSVLPESYNRPFAIPTGVALVGLGISLWREQARSLSEPVTRLASASLETAGVE